MKKMIFIGLMLLSAPAFGMQYLKDQICGTPTENLSHQEQVIEAIRSANVKQVLKLVKTHNTSEEDLKTYIRTANEHFGLAPEAKLASKAVGVFKLMLGLAVAYKTWDHFNEKYQIWNTPKRILNTAATRLYTGVAGDAKDSNPIHNLIIDIATISGFISAYGATCVALNSIRPKADYNSHLLIQLYLKNLKLAN